MSVISLGYDYSSITYRNQYRTTCISNLSKITGNWRVERKSYTAPTKVVKSDFLFNEI